MLFGLSSFLGWACSLSDLLACSEGIGLYVLATKQMFFNDLRKFLALFIPILIAFATILTAAWPAQADYNAPFDSWWRVLEALVYMTITGELTEKADGSVYASSLLAAPPSREDRGGWELGSAVFLMFEMLFALVSPLLFVNLLIAMLNSTYEETMESAALKWRVDFARSVLWCEAREQGSNVPTSPDPTSSNRPPLRRRCSQSSSNGASALAMTRPSEFKPSHSARMANRPKTASGVEGVTYLLCLCRRKMRCSIC